MAKRTILDKVSVDGQVFTVDEVEPGNFQSVFPSRLADKSALHTDDQAAWDYIADVMADDEQARIAQFNRQFA